MKIRLVNIGDIHFNTDSDWAVDKGSALGRAIATSIEQIEETILVVNGDLTQAGTQKQFQLARDFLLATVQAYTNATSIPMQVLCTPGNHDCDFSSDQSARSELLTKLRPATPNPSIAEVILKPLSNYFAFVDEVKIRNSIDTSSPYKSSYVVHTSNNNLEIVMLDSAWMSSKHEQPGSLIFPAELFTSHESNISRVIVLHHPPNWFKQPETMRDLIRWITTNGDLCFSGHEHSMTTSVRLDSSLRGVMYFEGGVFQANPSDQSGQFQIIDISTQSGTVDEYHYAWRTDHFAQIKSVAELNYAELTARASRTRHSDTFIAEIEDPSIPGSSNHANLRLKDIFVFPDSLEYDEHANNRSHTPGSDTVERRKILGRDLVRYLVDRKNVLLIGPERCGKTALAKQLVSELHSHGRMPLLFSGGALAKSIRENKSAEKAIRLELKRQFADVTLENLSQTYQEDAIAIVDDCEDIYDHNLAPSDLSNALAFYFPRQFLIASDEFAVLESQGEVSNNIGLPNFTRLQLLDLGYEKISELTSRWIKSAASDRSAAEIASSDLAKVITQVLATDFIPHHPWIVIVLLETSIRDDVQAMKNGSYGHLYHAILTAAMASEKRSGLDLNGKFNYLSYLAYKMFKLERGSLTEDECRSFHASYCDTLDRDLSFERVIEGLCDARILRSDYSGVSFNARFSYCYFIANYFKLKMEDHGIRDDVDDIVQSLYHRESANILLFLSHLAPGAWPLDLIIDRANSLFASAPLWNLDKDVTPILKIGAESVRPTVEMPETSADANSRAEHEFDDDQRRALQKKEDFDGRSVQVVETDQTQSEWESVIREVRAAYKLIRIMGQVLKNNVDSMEGAKKKAIVEAVFRLSRRMLGDAFAGLEEDFEDRRETVIRHIEVVRQESGKRGDTQSLIVKADRELIGVSYLACFAVTRNVVDAVGARGLQKTFSRVQKEDDAIPNRLYCACLAMENSGTFPANELYDLARDMRNNWFGLQLLQALVAYHFYMYDRPRELRQSVLEKLKIGRPTTSNANRTLRKPPKMLEDRRPNSRRK